MTGKQITAPGWRVLYTQSQSDEGEQYTEEERTLPAFTKGESGPHRPDLAEKWTTAPKPYTEATLLRAMETAGSMVEDEELRDALKENGIGLHNMEERVRELSGTISFSVESGFRIFVSVPKEVRE